MNGARSYVLSIHPGELHNPLSVKCWLFILAKLFYFISNLHCECLIAALQHL